MKIAHLVLGIAAGLGLTACSRSPEAAAPAPSAAEAPKPSDDAVQQEVTTPGTPAAEPAPPPAPAAAPVLDGRATGGSKAAQSNALDEEFKTLAEAERALNQAKSDLDRLALAQPTPSAARGKGEAEKKDSARAEGAASSAPSGLCENACKAFSSLSRAAGAVCRLDGSGGSHCTRAKRVLADSQQRVQSCACSASGE